eukprot:CAMPEP_0182429578 /NCGR_PEP_ID=MMETSP1167-20130531/31110_1 /TAXON_ID=2988 /ORGANISM="Mallomonas Sp, Strain CCMP3275" /LENGTH=346 /DNA_ID=CAMNT_0024613457 /DNA_START=145 /DNA_END=1185 /DNA_ORIENTATION=-
MSGVPANTPITSGSNSPGGSLSNDPTAGRMVELMGNFLPHETYSQSHMLKSTKKPDLISFIQYLKTYRQQNGKKKTIDLILPTTMQTYCDRLGKDLSYFTLLSDDDLIKELSESHNINLIVNWQKDLTDCKMKERDYGDYSEDAVDTYINNFSMKLAENPNYKDPSKGGATGKLLAKTFINGLEPLPFRNHILEIPSETYRDAIVRTTAIGEKWAERNSINERVQKCREVGKSTKQTATHSGNSEKKHSNLRCLNCNSQEHNYQQCPTKHCLKCNSSVPSHKFNDPDLCVHRKNYEARQKNHNQSYKAAQVRSNNSGGRSNEEVFDMMARVLPMLERLLPDESNKG